LKAYCVYKWTNNISTKAYIGVSNDVQRRWKKHIADARRGSSAAFHRAIRKYIQSSWTREILVDGLSFEEACVVEQQLIRAHNTLAPNGYNLTEGGLGLKGHHFSEEHRNHLKWSPERKALVLDRYAQGYHPSKGKQNAKGNVRSDLVMKFSKEWWIVTPTGSTLKINNLAAFCRAHGLNSGHMTRVAQGKLSQHKGYRCSKVNA
jgi:group I intron endonuclease